ncbi:MAG TPA: cytochrome ubiquinol oxidase subunit I [Pseudogracilibacillus sp.]|nr:cytochrome ubiquinol oxidase subunit I [Pseudogracilibacillus sp.]
MDPVLIARLQFAATTIFHYFYVPVSIGMAFTIAIMQTMYVIKKNDIYKKMVKFFAVLLLINFAVGVVTGIFQEFQFGMNWSDYSRYVGDVFGPSLAIEGLLAFFLESTFLGIWVFGWNRLGKKTHLASIWLVSLGSVFSAFWILTANSFMHNPVGFELEGGRAQMNDFLAILGNPHFWAQFPHVLLTSLTTGTFIIAGISAWKILRKHQLEMFKKAFKISITILAAASFVTLFTGHWQAQHLVEEQPMKMAAVEALWEESGDPAPFNVVASINEEEKENNFEVQIPMVLSFLSYNQFEGSVTGLNDMQEFYEDKYGPGDYIPNVTVLFWSFRVMTGIGGLMVLLGLYGSYASRKTALQDRRLYLNLMVYGMIFPFVANTAGWLITEMGRQPWVVFGFMKTEDAISPSVTANEMLFSLLSFTAIYTILGVLTVYLFQKHIKKNDDPEDTKEEMTEDPFDNEGGNEVGS